MYTKEQMQISPELRELFETVSYDDPPEVYITPETDEDPDEEPAKPNRKPDEKTIRSRLLAAGYTEDEIVERLSKPGQEHEPL